LHQTNAYGYGGGGGAGGIMALGWRIPANEVPVEVKEVVNTNLNVPPEPETALPEEKNESTESSGPKGFMGVTGAAVTKEGGGLGISLLLSKIFEFIKNLLAWFGFFG